MDVEGLVGRLAIEKYVQIWSGEQTQQQAGKRQLGRLAALKAQRSYVVSPETAGKQRVVEQQQEKQKQVERP